MSRRKTAPKSPPRKRAKRKPRHARGPKPAKRKPSHGRGLLYVGGVPGNKGGTGRPSNLLRAKSGVLCDLMVEELGRRVVNHPRAIKTQDGIRLVQVAGHIALEDEDAKQAWAQQLLDLVSWELQQVLRSKLPADQANEVLGALHQRLLAVSGSMQLQERA